MLLLGLLEGGAAAAAAEMLACEGRTGAVPREQGGGGKRESLRIAGGRAPEPSKRNGVP